MTIQVNAALRRKAQIIAIVSACATLFLATLSSAQADTEIPPLFGESTTLQLTLEAPLRALTRNTRSRREHDGFVRYIDADGTEVVLDVEVRVRGNSRLAECDFPPLRLDFRRRRLEGTIFAGQNRLKLVTLCKSADEYRDYLYLEHDIYRLFNALTDHSFRVRRVDVEYVSTDSKREPVFTEPAFMIEDEHEVAARNALSVLNLESTDIASLDAGDAALLSVFHFVIGNTDWSALRAAAGEGCCHNGKLLAAFDGARIVLPYDFDQAGLINTQYSQPANSLPIRTVRQRLYRGFCAMNNAVPPAVEHILDRRTPLEALLGASEASAAARTEALAYLRESLDLLADNDSLTEEILEACR